jgi:hypothetical protein
MPKLTRGRPKDRKHKGRAVVKIAGQVHDLGPHGTRESWFKYDRLIAEWLLEGRPTDRKKLEPITVVEVIDARAPGGPLRVATRAFFARKRNFYPLPRTPCAQSSIGRWD